MSALAVILVYIFPAFSRIWIEYGQISLEKPIDSH